jgi:hypothetical protein
VFDSTLHHLAQRRLDDAAKLASPCGFLQQKCGIGLRRRALQCFGGLEQLGCESDNAKVDDAGCESCGI